MDSLIDTIAEYKAARRRVQAAYAARDEAYKALQAAQKAAGEAESAVFTAEGDRSRAYQEMNAALDSGE